LGSLIPEKRGSFSLPLNRQNIGNPENSFSGVAEINNSTTIRNNGRMDLSLPENAAGMVNYGGVSLVMLTAMPGITERNTSFTYECPYVYGHSMADSFFMPVRRPAIAGEFLSLHKCITFSG
jgi:hypothetical protein